MEPLSSGFNVMGMNIGSNERDYTLLHNKLTIGEDETLETLLDQYRDIDEDGEEKGVLEEKIFYCLLNQRSVNLDPEDEILSNLLINKGLDVIEANIATENGTNFVEANIGPLCEALRENIKDKYGAKQFLETYPKLCNYLRSHHNRELPNGLKLSVWARIKRHFRTPAQIERTETPLIHHLQYIKDRLAEQFFTTLIHQPDRPAVLSLQEVGSRNESILHLLEHGDYKVFLCLDRNKDTAIALDRSRFTGRQFQLQSNNTAVLAEDLETGEEFIFISTHATGYRLEQLANASLEDQEAYLKNVAGSLEFSTYADIQALLREIQSLRESHPDAKVVVQGDFNTFPEYFEDLPKTESAEKIKGMNIFNMLQENHFDLYREDLPTEKIGSSDSLPLRELDYVFADSSLHGRVERIAPEDQELTLADTNSEEAPHFDPMLLFSDHRPIYIHIGREAISRSEKSDSTSET